jgi:DNA-binding LytR/AlgR family response regulator
LYKWEIVFNFNKQSRKIFGAYTIKSFVLFVAYNKIFADSLLGFGRNDQYTFMKNQGPIQIAIVEDDIIIAQELRLNLQKLGYEVLAAVSSGEALLEVLQTQIPDLVLLDINLAGAWDGIDTAQQLRQHVDLPFIFLSALADRQTLERAKITDPEAYLVKPAKIEDLQRAIELALHRHKKQQSQPAPQSAQQGLWLNEQLFVKTKNRLERVDLSKIQWIEARDIYCVLKTTHEKHVVSMALKAFEQLLPMPPFLRVHRSYIVAIDKIEAIEDNNLLIEKEYIPVGKTYREALLKHLRIV